MAVTLHAHTMSAVLSGNRGAVGVGIADITFNDDYTMTITLTDGSTYTSGNLRGAQGIPGIDAEYDGEELVITEGNDTISDGGEVSTIRVKGEARTIRDRVTEEMACGAYPTETASGDIVSITDGAEDIPVKTLTVAVEPKQAGSGDPSPDNIRAITGWDAVQVVRCGKNLIDGRNVIFGGYPSVTTRNGITLTKASDGKFTVSGTASAETRLDTRPDVKFKAGHTYTISVKGLTGGNIRIIFQGNPANVGLNYTSVYPTADYSFTFTPSSDVTFSYFYIDVQNGRTVNNTVSVQIEQGSTATDYEPYNATTYPIPLPSTVYGGTLDVSSGVMTVDRKYITADGSTIKAIGGYGANGAERLPAISLTGASKGATAITGIIASYLKTATSSSVLQSTSNTIGIGSGGALIVLHINDIIGNNGAHGYSSDTELFAACNAYLASNPLQIAYKLATPYIITLNPATINTLLGNSTIYADAGQVTVAYRADVGLYIDKRIAEVQALVLES